MTVGASEKPPKIQMCFYPQFLGLSLTYLLDQAKNNRLL